MAGYHIIEQGEHITSLAVRFGFQDFTTVWNHPNNAQLKAARSNPNVLYPGDQIYIPDKQERKEPCPTTKRHRFQVRLPKLELRLRLLNMLGKPLKNTTCDLQIDGQSTAVTTDGDGRIQRRIPVNARDVKLVADGIEYSIQIGELDPADEDSGLFSRLNNLGYYIGNLNDVDSEDFRFALALFQLDQGLDVNGESSPEVLSKLEESHGC